MNKLNFLLILTLFVSTISCSTQKTALPEDYSTNPLELPLEVLSVKVIDKRSTPLKAMNWDLSKIVTKKQTWVGNPPLKPINEKDIENIIQRASKSGGIPANIEFRVLKGECKVDADWKSATEYVVFKGELEVNIVNEKLPFTSHAEIRYENPSRKTTEARTLELYNLAVRNATHSILKQMKDGFEEK
ncbi:MAG: hypothetical protein AB8B69_07755 [Chitinophagales bacterium]